MKISLTELEQIFADRAELEKLRAERAVLLQRILDLVAGDAAMQEKIAAAFNKSEAVEAKMRAAIPNG